MKMICKLPLLFILIISVNSCDCDDVIDGCEGYVPGVVAVYFLNTDISLQEAEAIVTSYGLTFESRELTTLNWIQIIVDVPVGSEQNWADVFNQLAEVDIAERDGVVCVT